jgi:HEAT repeat protein
VGLALVALCLGGLLARAATLPAHADGPAAAPDVVKLVTAYRSVAGLRDDAGYAAQRTIATSLSDLARTDAQKALRTLLEEQGAGDRRRAAILLAAWVRRGSPTDLDQAILWVERTHDPRLLGQLHTVVGDVLDPTTRKHLREEALARATPLVKAELARGLGGLGDPESVVPLLALLGESHLGVRLEALGALGMLKDVRAQGPMLAMLGDGDPRLREAAARALGMLGAAHNAPRLVPMLDDPSPRVVESTATSLALLGAPTSIGPLIERLARAEKDDLRVADTLARALERITGRQLGTDAERWRSWWAVRKDLPFTRDEQEAQGGTVEPLRYHGFPVRSSKVVFVLDVSRSMGWNGRLERARTALVDVLQGLPRSTRFNLVVFSERAHRWEGSLVVASLVNVRRAVQFVQRTEPQSGTAAYEALEAAFAEPDVDTIFFLSDGHPSGGTVLDPELILADVAKWNRIRRVRVHAIALMLGEPPAAFAGTEDADRATDFMRRLAEENDGSFKLIK